MKIYDPETVLKVAAEYYEATVQAEKIRTRIAELTDELNSLNVDLNKASSVQGDAAKRLLEAGGVVPQRF